MKKFLVPLLLLASGPAVADALPVPPIPPANHVLAEAAPVPDTDARGPLPLPSDKPSLDVRMFRSRNYDPSLGFTPGSRYQTAEDRKPIQTPGLSISVPIK